MAGVAAITMIALVVLACLGLFMSGVAAMRRARLDRKRFQLRHGRKAETRTAGRARNYHLSVGDPND